MAAASPGLRHLRLMMCQAGDGHVSAAAAGWPGLSTLVLREAAGAGAGLGPAGAVAAAAGLPALRALAVTLLPGADVAPLGGLASLEYLLLDGRSNAEVTGWQGLCRLSRLRGLCLPLLQMQQSGGGALAALQSALRGAAVANSSSALRGQHGCQWFSQFTDAERAWWRPPAAPWQWHPHLSITV
ncbi:MAG: hypothetical protein J3K34DRAFT_403783 [Monoraphidium minutum]|nr:MAG: hypothetical protein J3K34DRAFT_403783 [Monoraphidium minutum]